MISKRNIKDIYTLSPMQEGMLFHWLYDRSSYAYFEQYSYRIVGDLDIDISKKSLNELLKRYDILRTVFIHEDVERPIQVVLKEREIDFFYKDISNHGRGDDEKEAYIKEFKEKDKQRSFDLSKDVLMRASVIKLDQSQYEFIWSFHHILLDGWCMSIVVSDYYEIYNSFLLKKPYRLPRVMPYRTYIQWLEMQDRQVSKKYWKKYLESYEESAVIPGKDKASREGFEKAQTSLIIEPELIDRLNDMAAGNQVTFNIIFRTIWGILLGMYNRKHDVVFGVVVSGRPPQLEGVETMVGLFTNTIPVRIRFKQETKFKELLKEVQKDAVEGQPHHYYPLADVQAESLLKQDLIDHIFTFENYPYKVQIDELNVRETREELNEKEIKISMLNEKIFDQVNYDFCIIIVPVGEFTVQFEYNANVFQAEWVQTIKNHYDRVIRQIVNNEELCIDDLNLLTREEKKQLVYDFNSTEVKYPGDTTLEQLFARQAKKTPDKVAVLSKNESLTYSGLDEKSNQLANYLCSGKNVLPDERIGILLDNSIPLIIAIWSTLKAGPSYVPLDPSSPRKRLKDIIDDAGIAVVLSQKKYIETLNSLQWICESFHTFLCMDSEDIYRETEVEKNELMNEQLWNYVAEIATDKITGGGWNSSYTGESFSKTEMDEYGDNILKKITPLLHPQTKVLEIGCASGITMFRIVPKVGFYCGTDLSRGMIEKNKERINKEGYENIRLYHLPAHEIHNIEEKDFDLIIMNSVIHCFSGHNYLREVLRQVVKLMGEKGHIFIGDIMDLHLKKTLEKDMMDFKEANKGKDFKTKTDWSSEFFVSREFFEDLSLEIPGISGIKFSKKIYTIENELTKFRYDALIQVDNRAAPAVKNREKYKRQEDTRILENYRNTPPVTPAAPGDLAYIIYTSGTTGKPKGIMINRESLVNYVLWGIKKYIGGKPSRYPMYTSVSFDLTITSIYLPLLSGNAVVIYEDENKSILLHQSIEDDAVEAVKITPSHLKMLQNELILKNSGVRLFIVGGEELETSLASDISQRFDNRVEIYNEYGPTEATVGCMIYKFNPLLDKRKGVPIGIPIDNMRIYLLDNYQKPVPRGISGEIFISGLGLARGYLNKSALTAETFLPDPLQPGNRMYKTGDLARMLPEGNIEFLGRIDQQVKIRGFRIELGEIESQLSNHNDIRESVVVSKEDETGDHYLCAYFVSDVEVDTANLKKLLAAELPNYMVPTFFVQLEEIPLTGNGKLDRKALPAPGIKAADDIIVPRTETEKKLAAIWSRVLGIDKNVIGINSDFFQLGGHSLRATIIISKIHQELNIKIPLAELFENPTISKLAEYIAGAGESIFQGIVPVEKKEYYEQSSAQKRLFFLEQFEHIGTTYNMPGTIILEEKIDKEKFTHTIKELIDRHETLRTSFWLIENKAVQRIHPLVDFEIRELQCHNRGPEEISKEFLKPFDLTKAPLLRVGLAAMPDGKYLFLFDMHHIICDGTAMNILVEDFASLYSGKTLAPLKIQYLDFSIWQNDLFSSGKIKEQENYWLDIYTDKSEIPKLDLPTDFPRPAVFTFTGADYFFSLDEDNSTRFKRLGGEHNATLFMNLLAAYNVLLHKYTGQEDIIVGCDIAGRPHADLQDIIGMFVNELPMRNYPENQKNYIEFLNEVKDTSIKAFENQDYQFEQLVDVLDLERDPSRNPLFDMEFVVQNTQQASTSTKGFSGQFYEQKSVTTKFDIALDVDETADAVHFRFQYSTSLFKIRTIETLARHFLNIITAIAHNPGIRLGDIDITTQNEKQQILFQFNNTKRDLVTDTCFPRLFENQVGKTPSEIAVGHQDELISYGELDKKANQLANYLRLEKNIGPNDRAAIWMDRSINFLIAVLAIMKAGGAYVPIEPVLPEERIAKIINDAEIGVVISREKYQRSVNRLQWECPTFHTYISMDRDRCDSLDLPEEDKIDLGASEELWNYVVNTAVDDITAGGWLSSYTGEPFTKEEMDEYGDNILKKLMPLLQKNMRVLEIGCASGITMYRIAPRVGFYYGTDISSQTIEKNRRQLKNSQYNNIHLECLPAHEIDEIDERDFDLIIINSVVQSFHGHHYLVNVLRKAVDLLAEKAYLFIGDIMDLDSKQDLIKEMKEFKQANEGKGYTTKVDWTAELFLSRAFWENMAADIPEIERVEFSKKIYTIENELTKFRYDALININKTSKKNVNVKRKHKYQHGLKELSQFDSRKAVVQSDPGDLAYVIYTSGTTGQPKGVLIHQLGMINHMYAKINDLSITAEDIIAQTASASFDISVWQFLAALIVGGRTVIFSKEMVLEPLEFLQALQQKRITIWESVPSLMTAFFEVSAQEDILPLEQLRWMMLTGEPLTPELVRKWYWHYPGIKVINAYGPTEASDDITHHIVHQVPSEFETSIPIGKPLQNLHIYILDKNLSLCPVGVRGEICVAGIGVGKGYWKDAPKTADAFIPNPFLRDIGGDSDYAVVYKTGDLGYFKPDGTIECLGRLDHQVKIRGNRIELREIERQLLNIEEINDAVVIAKEDEGENKFLCAYIVCTRSELVDQLRELLAKELPDYMIPAYFIPMEKLPVNSRGKINRNALPEPGIKKEAGYTAPRDDVEEKLAVIWSEVLGIEKNSIGIHTDFFNVGGHSLRATILVSQIHKKLNVKLPLSEVFRTPNIEGLARYIRGAVRAEFASIEPVEEKEYYGLSHAQERLWILDQLEKGMVAYNIAGDYEFAKLNREAFEKAIETLVRRHEILRTTFITINGEPKQKIHDYESMDFSVRYIRPGKDENIENVCKSLREEEEKTPFNLKKGPLLRTSLLHIEENRYLFLFTMHHIVSDGWSKDVMTKEFMALYGAYSKSNANPLPSLPIQYKDYTQWHNNQLSGNNLEKHRSYWLNTFSGEIPVLRLPTDFPRPNLRSFEGGYVLFPLSKEISEHLKKIGRESGGTLFMIFLALVNVFLYRYTNQTDIIVGTPVAERDHEDLENQIGFYVNMLALRNKLKKGETFGELLQKVKINTLGAFEHQVYPFDMLAQDLKLGRDMSRNPLFDIVVTALTEDTQLEDNTELESGLGASKHDLRFRFIDKGGQIMTHIQYNRGLFTKESIMIIKERLTSLITDAASNIDQEIDSLNFLTEFDKIKTEDILEGGF